MKVKGLGVAGRDLVSQVVAVRAGEVFLQKECVSLFAKYYETECPGFRGKGS